MKKIFRFVAVLFCLLLIIILGTGSAFMSMVKDAISDLKLR
jgi:hypothetical protein